MPLFLLFIARIKIICMNSTAGRGQVSPGVSEGAITAESIQVLGKVWNVGNMDPGMAEKHNLKGPPAVHRAVIL